MKLVVFVALSVLVCAVVVNAKQDANAVTDGAIKDFLGDQDDFYVDPRTGEKKPNPNRPQRNNTNKPNNKPKLNATRPVVTIKSVNATAPAQDPVIGEFLNDQDDFYVDPRTGEKKPNPNKPQRNNTNKPNNKPKLNATRPVVTIKSVNATAPAQDPVIAEFLNDHDDFYIDPRTGEKKPNPNRPQRNNTKPKQNATRPITPLKPGNATGKPKDPVLDDFLNDHEDFYIDPVTGQPRPKDPNRPPKRNNTNGGNGGNKKNNTNGGNGGNKKNITNGSNGGNKKNNTNGGNKKNNTNGGNGGNKRNNTNGGNGGNKRNNTINNTINGGNKKNNTKRPKDDGISLSDEKLGKFLSRPLTNADYFSNTTYTHLLIQQAKTVLKLRKLTFKYESTENGELAVKAGRAYNFTVTRSPTQLHLVFRVSQDAARAIASALEEVLDKKEGAINVEYTEINGYIYVKLIIHQTRLPTFSQKITENGDNREWTYALQVDTRRFEIGLKFKTGFDLDGQIGQFN